MQYSASLCFFSQPSLWFVSASVSGLALHGHVSTHSFVSPLLLLILPGAAIAHIANAIIGLSCLAIAATVGSFLTTSRKDLPARWIIITVASCSAVAGAACLLAAAVSARFHPRLIQTTPLALAILAALTASLLPFLLSYLRSSAHELESATEAARKHEACFLAAGKNTTDALMLLDALRAPSGRIEDFLFTYLNPNAEKLVARPGNQVLGARLTRILPLQSSSSLFEQFCQVVITGKPLRHEFPLDPKDPDSPWMRHLVTKLDEGIAITASDITASKREVREILRQDQYDPLTSLPNHLLLEDRVEQAIARAVRYKDKVGIFLLNLDAFQQINDRHGRIFGDEVLCTTAARLRSAIRATDTVVRLDADEFIVIMPDIKLEIDVRRTAATLIASIRKPFRATNEAAADNRAANPGAVQITCSLGAAIYPDSAVAVADLLAAADTAMARAKAHGKNQYILYDPLIDDPSDSSSDSSHTPALDTEQCAD
jgi:diguanylate cyclase (GGDEF)-like protein